MTPNPDAPKFTREALRQEFVDRLIEYYAAGELHEDYSRRHVEKAARASLEAEERREDVAPVHHDPVSLMRFGPGPPLPYRVEKLPQFPGGPIDRSALPDTHPPERQDRTAEALLEEALTWAETVEGEMPRVFIRITEALALIRADRERVARAIAALDDGSVDVCERARTAVIILTEGREP